MKLDKGQLQSKFDKSDEVLATMPNMQDGKGYLSARLITDTSGPISTEPAC